MVLILSDENTICLCYSGLKGENMKSKNAVILTVVVMLVFAGAIYFGLSGARGQITGGVTGQAVTGQAAEAQISKLACPDEDGKVDLAIQYIDKEADSTAGLQTDYRLYEIIDNVEILVDTANDATSTTYGNYTTYANKLACSKMQAATDNDVLYVVYLGDETQEYYRRTEIKKKDITNDPVRVKVDGAGLATITLSGYDDSIEETTWNMTVGSGAVYSDASFKLKANTADAAIEAKNGFIAVIGYNDTAWKDPQVVGTVEVDCPKGAGSLVTNDDTVDGTKICWKTVETYLADFQSKTYDVVFEAESAIDPVNSLNNYQIDICILDQNYYQDGEKGSVMLYGYTDENDNDIGQTTCTVLTAYFI